MEKLLVVDISPMPYLQYMNDDTILHDISDDTIISHTKTPKGPQISCQRCSQGFWLRMSGKAHHQKTLNACAQGLVNFSKLFLGFFRKFDDPERRIIHYRRFHRGALLRPWSRFFLVLKGFFFLQHRPPDNLHGLQYNFPPLLLGRKKQNEMFFVPELQAFESNLQVKSAFSSSLFLSVLAYYNVFPSFSHLFLGSLLCLP